MATFTPIKQIVLKNGGVKLGIFSIDAIIESLGREITYQNRRLLLMLIRNGTVPEPLFKEKRKFGKGVKYFCSHYELLVLRKLTHSLRVPKSLHPHAHFVKAWHEAWKSVQADLRVGIIPKIDYTLHFDTDVELKVSIRDALSANGIQSSQLVDDLAFRLSLNI